MAEREIVVLGSASQAPTRRRNHNGYLLRWNGEGILFDPGEGTQRQFAFADVSAASITRICISHFHGDHCLGLPGILMRLALDDGHLPVTIHYPASGEAHFQHLRLASIGQEHVSVDARPVATDGQVHEQSEFVLSCRRLQHRVDAFGWRLDEPDGRRMLPDRLAAAGVEGTDIGRLRSEGHVVVDGKTISVEEMSEHRPGQSFAFIMDTAWCDAALQLADGVDLVVCESTFLDGDEALAEEYGHMTARQAGRLAREAGARRLLISHFSRRYDDAERFGIEAREEFDDVVVAEDLMRVPVPARR
jgi:ribonuclease Z